MLKFSTALLKTRRTPYLQHSLRGFSSSSTEGDSHSDFEPVSKALSSDELKATFTKWIDENDIVIFMKGTKKQPLCGFSRFVVVLMNAYGQEFKDVDVLADDQIRSTIKEYSNWPTIPQVYIKQQFVGGCDIMKEMHEDGSLKELLQKEGLIKH